MHAPKPLRQGVGLFIPIFFTEATKKDFHYYHLYVKTHQMLYLIITSLFLILMYIVLQKLHI